MATEEDIPPDELERYRLELIGDTGDLERDAKVRENRRNHRIERAKFVAAALDRAGTAVFGLGGFTPILDALQREPVTLSGWTAGIIGVCIAFGFTLHLWGQSALAKGYGI